jgi:catechol 2,3-dioxygenase-like lactoylglutathione lyase family enzyme
VPVRGIQHVDLAVGDVERSLAFYYGVLGPLGLTEKFRNPTYRQTEEVVTLSTACRGSGCAVRTGVSTDITK